MPTGTPPPSWIAHAESGKQQYLQSTRAASWGEGTAGIIGEANVGRPWEQAPVRGGIFLILVKIASKQHGWQDRITR
jgi:hypothetical protein